MPKLNCTIYSCGKNIGGDCHSDEVTISWENVCNNKMVAGEDDLTKYYKDVEKDNEHLLHEIRELESKLDDTDGISYDLDKISDNIDKVKEYLSDSLEKIKDSVDDIRSNF